MQLRKTLIAIALSLGFIFSGSNVEAKRVKKEDYPTYPDMKPKKHYEVNQQANIEAVIGNCSDDKELDKEGKERKVNIED